jgi:hypothetical protein
MPLAKMQPQLKQLLLLRSSKARVTAAELKCEIADVPASWLLGQRKKAPVSTVELSWELDVGKLKEAVQVCAAQQKKQYLNSPGVTPPLRGMAFQITVKCAPRTAGTSSAVSIGVYARAADAPPDASYTLTFGMSAAPQEAGPTTSRPLKGTKRWGFGNFFKVGPMAGGWDEAAWVAKGLLANGPLVLKLSVSKVGHMGKPLR